jgi:hypothetical protein
MCTGKNLLILDSAPAAGVVASDRLYTTKLVVSDGVSSRHAHVLHQGNRRSLPIPVEERNAYRDCDSAPYPHRSRFVANTSKSTSTRILLRRKS